MMDTYVACLECDELPNVEEIKNKYLKCKRIVICKINPTGQKYILTYPFKAWIILLDDTPGLYEMIKYINDIMK